ncbi:MAG: SAV_2336 N-terminal domain-related protein, partial [Gloeotrichia echinulata HAB0833]
MSVPLEKENPKLPEAEINLTAQELADIIWLIVQIKPSIDTAEVAPVPTQGNSPTISSPTPDSESIGFPQIVESIENTTPAYVDSRRNHPSESASAGLPLKVTDPLALRNTLALGRSLRPLMRKVPSLTETVLDEEATVTSIAEEDFWLPVLQPVSTRWLEVALVIEETARYPLWRQILTEFQQLLERHGAFRNVSLWHLKMGDKGEVQLYLKHRQASLKELNDPSGRRLIWLVSDCVSPIWHDGSLLKVLRDWARIQPVSLLQLLPERLWSRTALGWGIEVKLYSENPGVSNARLSKTRQPVDIEFNSPQALTLPIVTLE